MDHQSPSRRADLLIAELAGRQYGVVARWQLLRRGVTRQQIVKRTRSGHLRPIHRGVYLVGHEATHPLAKPAAAILACHPGATLSHRTAAALQGLLPYPAKAACWITKPGGDQRRTDIRVIAAQLHPVDRTRHHRLPITTPARTLLDLASLPGLSDEQLEEAAAEAHALRDGSGRRPAIVSVLERNAGRRGAARLRALLDREIGPQRTHEGTDRRLRALIRHSNLPAPETCQVIHGREIDFLWRAERVVVEADSYAFHSSARAWARDIGKSNKLQQHGYIVLRFSWYDVTERPAWVLAEITLALGLRAAA